MWLALVMNKTHLSKDSDKGTKRFASTKRFNNYTCKHHSTQFSCNRNIFDIVCKELLQLELLFPKSYLDQLDNYELNCSCIVYKSFVLLLNGYFDLFLYVL